MCHFSPLSETKLHLPSADEWWPGTFENGFILIKGATIPASANINSIGIRNPLQPNKKKKNPMKSWTSLLCAMRFISTISGWVSAKRRPPNIRASSMNTIPRSQVQIFARTSGHYCAATRNECARIFTSGTLRTPAKNPPSSGSFPIVDFVIDRGVRALCTTRV
ncbi:hypothetical protein CC80DRAFT_539039 [Byssothecium circinans]|uniref:Uncharacterized protein n=1 Tax=Byssothecium circinans TaxID=147558 RepID=A0A6A5TEY3_9PLEO|nr:hypothetical protein CC80DRAFT_539039 [Byssothecium circinans]